MLAREQAVAPPDHAAALAHVEGVARSHAAAVDRDARFPAEAIAAMREAGLLGALVPARHGGGGQSVRDVAATCHALGRCCAASAMILAMHHIQVACLVEHAGEAVWMRRFTERVARENLLLASVTSEVGVGGNMRNSICAVDPDGDRRFRLGKQASTISYGAYADALLVTARACPTATAGDQVLVVLPAAPGVLTRTGDWNTMGMRGTRSEAFTLEASGSTDQVLPDSFAAIAARTMVPVSHVLWASLWCGIAADAVVRARLFVRGKMRSGGGDMPDGAWRLVHATERLRTIEAAVRETLSSYESRDPESFALAASVNMLKTAASEGCLAVADEAMLICGFAGFSNDGPFSVSRHVRDLHSARLMVHNDRVRDSTARLLMMQAPTFGVA